MRKLYFAALVALTISALASCSTESQEAPVVDGTEEQNMLSISGDCAYHEITNSTGGRWTIVSTPSWITPVSYAGSDNITVYVESNSIVPRSAKVKVRYADGRSRDIEVRQSTESTGLSLQRSNAVGWGIDLRTHRDSRALTDQIFNAQRILDLDPIGITNTRYTHHETTMCYGESYESFQDSLAVKAGVEIKGDAFTLDLQGAFGKEALRQGNRAFAWNRDRYNERMVTITVDPVEAILGGTFTTDFQKQYDAVIESNASDASIRDLIDRYGTHYVTTAWLGGYLDYYYSFEHSEMSDDMDIAATLNCAVKEKFSLDGDVQYKDNLAMLSETAIEYFKVMGGDAMTLTNLIVGGQQSQSALNTWANSLRIEDGVNASLELIGFDVLPISNLFMLYTEEGIPEKIDNYINRTLYYSTIPVTRSKRK